MRVYQPSKLDYGMAHIICVSRARSLLLNICDEAIWQWLNANTTTPIRREWMPWLVRMLETTNRIYRPETQFNCDVGFIDATTEHVDKLVKAMVRSGKARLT